MRVFRGQLLLSAETKYRRESDEEWADVGWFDTVEAAVSAAEERAGKPVEFVSHGGRPGLGVARVGNCSYFLSCQPDHGTDPIDLGLPGVLPEPVLGVPA